MSDYKLSNSEYAAIQNNLMIIAQWVNTMRLKEFIARINETETVAPFVDPTLYMKASSNLQALKYIAESLLPFKKEIDRTIIKKQGEENE